MRRVPFDDLRLVAIDVDYDIAYTSQESTSYYAYLNLELARTPVTWIDNFLRPLRFMLPAPNRSLTLTLLRTFGDSSYSEPYEVCRKLEPLAQWLATSLDIPYIAPVHLGGHDRVRQPKLSLKDAGESSLFLLGLAAFMLVVTIGGVLSYAWRSQQGRPVHTGELIGYGFTAVFTILLSVASKLVDERRRGDTKASDERESVALSSSEKAIGSTAEFTPKSDPVLHTPTDPERAFALTTLVWDPGKRVLLRRTMGTLEFSVGAFLVAWLVTGYLLCQLIALFSAMIISLLLVFALFSQVFSWLHEPEAEFEFLWSKRTMTKSSTRGRDVVGFGDLRGLEIRGKHTRSRQNKPNRSKTLWSTDLFLLLPKNEELVLGRGADFAVSDSPDIHEAADLAYRQFHPLARELADAIGISFAWKGFDGDPDYMPPDERAKRERAERQLPSPTRWDSLRALGEGRWRMVEAEYLELQGKDFRKSLDEAVRHYLEAVEKDPQNVDAYLDMAAYCNATDQSEKAIEIYDAGIEANPDHADLYMFRGLLRWRAGQQQDAIQDFDEYLRRDPERFGVIGWRCEVKIDIRRYKEALSDLEDADQLARASAFSHIALRQLHTLRAECYQGLGDYQTALEEVERARAYDPDDPYLPILRASIKNRQTNVD